MKKYFYIFFFTTIIIYSCNNEEAFLPAYLYINSIKLNSNISIQGAATHNITDVWVYVNDTSIGVFDKRHLIPIISNDLTNAEIKIFAGIRDNGIKQKINNYFLYKEVILKGGTEEGKIDTIDIVFNYVDHAHFVFIEGFENGNIFNKDIDGDENTSIQIYENNPRSGNKCGFITLSTEHSHFEATSKNSYYNLPSKGNLVYLEMDYKGNNEFLVGISGKDENGHEYKSDFILLKNQENWNKIYLNLTEKIQVSELKSYKIYFKAEYNKKNTTSTIFLDNIKLLYSQK